MHEEQFTEGWRKRSEVVGVMNKERKMATTPGPPPVRQVRKRHHHTLNRGHHTMTPLMRMPPLPSLPAQNITIFQMLQQIDKFQS